MANLCVKMLHKLEEVCTFLAKDLVVSNLFRNFAVGIHFERMKGEKSQTTELKKTNGATILNQPDTMLFQDACSIIEQAQVSAYYAVNEALIKRNWLLGMRIQHEVLKDKRAEYGEQVVKNLAEKLSEKYGRGYKKSNLYLFISFYQEHPNFFQSVTGKLHIDAYENIFQSVTGKSPIRLSWTNYSIILQENSADARAWYEEEAAREMWGTRTVQRNISSQYYHRTLLSQHKDLVHEEMLEKTTPLQDKLEFVKSPVIAEFLGF